MPEFVGQGTPISATGFDKATGLLGAQAEALWAVLAVETSGCGFQSDRRPKILFERHVFSRLTHGRFDGDDPDVSAPTRGGYGPGGDHQYLRLAAAMQLDPDAALKSASWGLGQIMGENHQAAGYDTVEAMTQAFVGSEDAQLVGLASFVAASTLKAALQARDWARFARLYNGPDFVANHYDAHLSQFYANYRLNGMPVLGVRAAQILLSYQGIATGGVDGVLGPATRAALRRFQTDKGLTASGEADDATLAALSAD